jgi:NADH:ubiquinone oxidoreductase subunit 5 (subunit L)/multisubunit Na+/H+ antiporter MnhA subunit
MLMVFFAWLGGVMFVLSGLSDAGNSAMMASFFVGLCAFYFIGLYYSRNTAEAKPN